MEFDSTGMVVVCYSIVQYRSNYCGITDPLSNINTRRHGGSSPKVNYAPRFYITPYPYSISDLTKCDQEMDPKNGGGSRDIEYGIRMKWKTTSDGFRSKLFAPVLLLLFHIPVTKDKLLNHCSIYSSI